MLHTIQPKMFYFTSTAALCCHFFLHINPNILHTCATLFIPFFKCCTISQWVGFMWTYITYIFLSNGVESIKQKIWLYWELFQLDLTGGCQWHQSPGLEFPSVVPSNGWETVIVHKIHVLVCPDTPVMYEVTGREQGVGKLQTIWYSEGLSSSVLNVLAVKSLRSWQKMTTKLKIVSNLTNDLFFGHFYFIDSPPSCRVMHFYQLYVF